ncbi:SseB family protein [Nocardia huaxiensis]|uniref:SseB family protein n=1 Tax=Nocardia huaxiensis TaxID=2755382 RepID=A0A7D6VE52_9NOCA|nr:SseB family protein [Nocardia huaxiensis]QLY30757.1 SseB family protein [Nocardia huaxiensis]
MNLSSLAKRQKLDISIYPGADVAVLPKPAAADFDWAAANPGKWQYFVDPTADKATAGPANVIGGWRADEAGGISETWLNPDFVPTAQYAKREITTGLELVIWRMDYGFSNLGQFMDTLLRSELIIVLPADDPLGERGWPLLQAPTRAAVVVYTSEGHLPNDTNPWLRRKVPGREVLEYVCGQEHLDLVINPESRTIFELQGPHLADWWQQLREAQRTDATPQEGR